MIDFKYSNTDFVINKTVSEVELLAQRLQVKMNWFLEEYQYDTSYGVPYSQVIFQTGVSLDTVVAILKEKILEDKEILSCNFSKILFSNGKLEYVANIQTKYGDLTLANTF